MTIGPLIKTSPSSAILMVVPGIGFPTDPTLWAQERFNVAPAVVSVKP
jgi:hypothetical protein